ncbi:MAG: mechanosensitive ion channel [Abditibacteriota bacterium]|nr:mechanosensitive ion channel [Abditibacteriota bacterium]
MNQCFGMFGDPQKLADISAKVGVTALKILLVLVIYLIVKKIVEKIITAWGKKMLTITNKVGEKVGSPEAAAARVVTMETVLRSTVNFVLGFVMIMILLGMVGIDLAPLLATAGVAGLAVGFGAQKLVKDVVSGFIIIAENQYAVGERVTIGGATGEVLELGIRCTRIKDDENNIHILSNGDVSVVVNHSRGEA